MRSLGYADLAFAILSRLATDIPPADLRAMAVYLQALPQQARGVVDVEAADPQQMVRGEKLYLSPVMDLFNGEIVAYEMNERPLFPLVGNMLKKALSRLTAQEAPMMHSDQGWQYQMEAYRQRLLERGLTQSMSRRGNCLDNAAMESFFGTLKSEFFYLNEFASIEQLQHGLHRYIHYYNHHRIKLKLKGLSPVQYRTQALSS